MAYKIYWEICSSCGKRVDDTTITNGIVLGRFLDLTEEEESMRFCPSCAKKFAAKRIAEMYEKSKENLKAKRKENV